jgi:hypothetical protein
MRYLLVKPYKTTQTRVGQFLHKKVVLEQKAVLTVEI